MSEPFQIPLENRVQESGGILRFSRFEQTGSDPFQIWMSKERKSLTDSRSVRCQVKSHLRVEVQHEPEVLDARGEVVETVTP